MKNYLKLSIVLFLLTITNIDGFSQCLIRFRCTKCNQNVDASSHPGYDPGLCPNKGYHNWVFEGYLTSECARAAAEEARRAEIEEERLKALCKRNTQTTWRGGDVIENYCPSGKPSKVSFNSGNKIYYIYESGKTSLISEKINDELIHKTEYNEAGQLTFKGKKNGYNYIGECYFESYNGNDGAKCSYCYITFDNQGNLIFNGKIEEMHEVEYNKCITSQDYKNYYKKYPDSKYVNNAHSQEIELAFKECKTSTDYRNYYRNYPNSQYVNDAKNNEIIFHWNEISTNWKADNYNEHLKNYSNSKFKNEATLRYKECISWEIALRYDNTLNNVVNVKNYISLYPNGHFKSESEDLLEKAYYNDAHLLASDECQGIPDDAELSKWKQYKELYPTGKYLSHFELRKLLLAASKNSLNSYDQINQQIKAYENHITRFGTLCDCHSTLNNKFDELIPMSKIKKNTRHPSMLYNLIIPGSGHYFINDALYHSDSIVKQRYPLVTTALVLGGLVSGTIFHIKTANTYNEYLSSNNPADWDGLRYDAQQYQFGEIISFGVAGAIWAIDYVNLIVKKSKVNKSYKILKQNALQKQGYKLAYNLTPSNNSLGLALTITLK